MSRIVTDAKLESPTARAKLHISPVAYWRAIDPGLHIGYRKSSSGGRWVARWYLRGVQPQRQQAGGGAYKHARGKAYHHETLEGITDDRQEADGAAVLSFAQAQKRVRELYAAFNAPTSSTGPITVQQACERYVSYLKAERKTGDDAEQRLAKHALPRLGDRPVAALTTEEVEAFKRGIVQRLLREAARRYAEYLETMKTAGADEKRLAVNAPPLDPEHPEVERRSRDTANRVFTSLKAALNRAFADPKNGIPSDAAWRRVKPFKKVGRAREIFLDSRQTERLINVTAGAFQRLVVSALLTGARPPHELAAAHVRDFHAELGVLKVDGKTGQRQVVLTKEGIRYFKEITSGRDPDELLLPKDDGNAWGKSHHDRPMRDAVKKAKLPKGTTIYALRHSHASQALLNGMNLKLLAENMGTSIAMLERHYGKFLAASRRQLIEESGVQLGLKPGKITSMTRVRSP